MQIRPIVALAVAASLLPVHAALAQPVEVAEGPTEGPFNAPAPDPAPPSLTEPEYKGNGLLYAAIGVTGLSWVSRLASIGIATSIDSCTNASCGGRVTAAAVLLYTAPVEQFIATTLVIPGGLLRGRHDGWRAVTTGSPDRNGKTFVIAGGVVFGVFTALSIALRPIYITSIINCVDSNLDGNGSTCGGLGGVIGYNIGAMVSDTASTAGAGLMSYGIGYNNYRRRYGSRVSAAPFGTATAYGLSLVGRF